MDLTAEQKEKLKAAIQRAAEFARNHKDEIIAGMKKQSEENRRLVEERARLLKNAGEALKAYKEKANGYGKENL